MPGNPDPHEKFTIIVNAQKKEVTHQLLTFDEVVNLAFPGGPRGGNWVYTVTYRNAADGGAGSLRQGQTVTIKNGTIFDVTQTDKS